jgi:hypothetical protein
MMKIGQSNDPADGFGCRESKLSLLAASAHPVDVAFVAEQQRPNKNLCEQPMPAWGILQRSVA